MRDDDWDGDDDEDEDWDDDEDDETRLLPCPECGAEVYDDAERCPECGHYIERAYKTRPWTGKPRWWIIMGLLGIGAVIWVLLRRGW